MKRVISMVDNKDTFVKKIVEKLINRIKWHYEWVLFWSKGLFIIGLLLLGGAILLTILGFTKVNELYFQSLISIAYFNISPVILTGFNWQQYIVSSGIFGAIGLGGIITSFTKGSFKEVIDSVVDYAQVELLYQIYDKKYKKIWIELSDYRTKLSDYTKLAEKQDELISHLIIALQNYCQTPFPAKYPLPFPVK